MDERYLVEGSLQQRYVAKRDAQTFVPFLLRRGGPAPLGLRQLGISQMSGQLNRRYDRSILNGARRRRLIPSRRLDREGLSAVAVGSYRVAGAS